jgi:hypothetical protein
MLVEGTSANAVGQANVVSAVVPKPAAALYAIAGRRDMTPDFASLGGIELPIEGCVIL